MSRELDALVGQHIMGWTYFLNKRDNYSVAAPDGTHSEPMFGSPKYDPSTGEKLKLGNWWDGLHELPYYSDDIAAAWEVVKKMTEDDYELAIFVSNAYDKPISAKFDYNPDLEKDPNGVFVERETEEYLTAPEAICKAALLAVGVDVEKELKA